MLFLLFRGRYGPLLRAAAGIAVIVFGLVASTPFLVVIGGLLLAWGATAGVGRLTGRRRNSGALGGTTVMLTTHHINEADHLADRVIVLSGGQTISDTPPRATRPRRPGGHPLPGPDPGPRRQPATRPGRHP